MHLINYSILNYCETISLNLNYLDTYLCFGYSTSILNPHQLVYVGLLERCDSLDVATFFWKLGVVEKWGIEFESLPFYG